MHGKAKCFPYDVSFNLQNDPWRNQNSGGLLNWPKGEERETRRKQDLSDPRVSDLGNNIPRQYSRGGKKESSKFPSDTTGNSTERNEKHICYLGTNLLFTLSGISEKSSHRFYVYCIYIYCVYTIYICIFKTKIPVLHTYPSSMPREPLGDDN